MVMKRFMHRCGGGGGITVCSELLSHGTKNFRWRGPLCFRNFWYGKNNLWIEIGGLSRFSVGTFLSYSAEKVVGERFFVSRSLLMKKFMHRR